MSFIAIAIIAIAALGLLAALLSIGSTDEPVQQAEGNCAACSSRAACKLADTVEQGRKHKEQKPCHEQENHAQPGLTLLVILIILTSCSTKHNTATNRWWHSFNARYNTYFNGSQAFIEGSMEKENGNHDNFTELIPLYTVANKQSRDLGKGNFDTAIEKAEKVIKLHSIKQRPEWNRNRRKTAKDIEWLSRREYNPFLWHAWLLMGKSQFQQGKFEEAAATFSYMARLYQTQPAIKGMARAWQAKSYTELDWLYDAEDVINKQQRDTIHYKTQKDWDYTLANYHLHSQQYEQAIPYLRKVIKHERRRKQKAREWFIMGQIQALLGHRNEAYKAFKHVVRLNPPYELEFNARIAQTEVMAEGNAKRMVNRLKRMAASDNNKEYLDQVYYAIGNIHLAQHDTLQAIEAYEQGNKKATRSGIEKGVLLLTLGNVYWEREKYADAQRCYGEAIGLLDKERADYQQLADRSKVLDELVPHTSAVELQDSLQRLARMPEAERNKVIDRLIAELIKKEKEERSAQEEAEADKVLQEQEAKNGANLATSTPAPTMPGSTQSGQWYFYNPQAVNQGKQAFQRQWGKRENQDNWQRINQTVVSLLPAADSDTNGETADNENYEEDTAATNDSIAAPDTTALDPHTREYYLAQIPFTSEQLAESHSLIKDGLFHSGIIFKDKLDNLKLGEKALTRLTTQYPDYEQNDQTWYHLFLLYSRQGRTAEADHCLAMLKDTYPESQWTILLSDPNFAENQRFGVHIEDSLYAATYEAFKANRNSEVRANAQLSESRFPLGLHRPKFIFIEGLTLLNEGSATACTERMKRVVEDYPQSEVSEMAGMILRGVQQGRQLRGGKFDISNVWTLRNTELAASDSTRNDSLTFERAANYVFMLAFQPDSVSQNQLLFELARHNFSNYLVRNFEIAQDQDANGMARMLVSGFLSYDETLQYARQLYAVEGPLSALLRQCRSLIVSEHNLRLLGTAYSYSDYEIFFEQQVAPIKITDTPLLDEPGSIVQEEDEEDGEENVAPADADGQRDADDDFFQGIEQLLPPAAPAGTVQENPDFTDMPAPEPAATETPAAQENPDFTDMPAPEPAATDTPAAQEEPDFTDMPAPEPAATETPAAQEEPDFTDMPAPVPAQQPLQQQPPQNTDYIEFDDDFWR